MARIRVISRVQSYTTCSSKLTQKADVRCSSLCTDLAAISSTRQKRYWHFKIISEKTCEIYFSVALKIVRTNYLSYSEQRDESGQQEGGAKDEVNEQRNQNKSPKIHNVLVAYVTDASDRITVHGTHGQDGDGFHRWDEPGSQVEILTVGRDGFLAPF